MKAKLPIFVLKNGTTIDDILIFRSNFSFVISSEKYERKIEIEINFLGLTVKPSHKNNGKAIFAK